jgi:hypothetical protein
VQPDQTLGEKVFPADGDQCLHGTIATQQRGEIRAARSQTRDEAECV